MKDKLLLYHGSDHEVGKPIFGGGKRHNDYGRGFYCTQEVELAREWACSGASEAGYVNEYELELDGLKIIRLYERQYNILNWFAILLDNRIFDVVQPIPRQNKEYILSEFLPPYRDADVIIGYRADDSYFSFAKNFLENTISLQDLSRAMKLGKLGRQVVLMSEKAFDRLSYLGCTSVDTALYRQKRAERDASARNEFKIISERGPEEDAVLAFDIVRNKWKNDDPRLR